MRHTMIVAAALLALTACGSETRSPPSGAHAFVLLAQPRPAPSQVECVTTDDCGADEICAGPTGCDKPWTCQPAPEVCLVEAFEYCTCAGATIWGDRECIGTMVAHE